MISRCTGLLPLATKLGPGYIFTGVCDSVHKGGGGKCMVVAGVWFCPGGACIVVGGMCGCQGVCGCQWGMCGCQGVCMVAGGMCGCWGVCVWLWGGACMVAGGMHGCQGAGMHGIRRDTVNERAVRILL